MYKHKCPNANDCAKYRPCLGLEKAQGAQTHNSLLETNLYGFCTGVYRKIVKTDKMLKQNITTC